MPREREKRATIRDVAREANVSVATISYVLNGKESIREETRARVKAAMQKLNYVPDLSARGLSNKSSKLVGVVVPQTEPGSRLMLNNPFYSEIVGSIEYNARINGYHLLISGADADADYLKLAKERNLDGIVIIGIYPEDFFSELKKSRIPIVLVDSYCDDHYFHSIQINDRYGAYIATKHLLENGHRDIALISGAIKEGGVVRKRYEGYTDALQEFDVPVRKSAIFEGIVDFESGMDLADRILRSDQPFTAAFATADILAIGAMKRFHASGWRIPERFSLVGFDDLNISRYMDTALTTIHQDIYRKGQIAVEMILKGITEPGASKQEVILPVGLVERDSVRHI